MPNSTVPANDTALPFNPAIRGRIPAKALATTQVLTEAELAYRLTGCGDFEADDSGAMQHVIADDPHEAFLVAFKTLVAVPWPKGVSAQTSQA